MFCYLTCYYSDEHKQNDLLAGNLGTTVMVHGALGSPGPVVSNKQDQQANIDVSKPTVEPPQRNEPEKPVDCPPPSHLSVASRDQQPPQHHGSGSDHSNRQVSQLSEVTKSTTTQSETQPTSSFGMLVGDVLHCFFSVCLCVYMFVYVCVYVYVFVYVCVCICVCVFVCVFTCIHIVNASVLVCTCVSVYMLVYICISIYIRMCLHA